MTGLDVAHPKLQRCHYTQAEIDEIAVRYRTWGDWGPDDELGAANYITEATVAAAGRLIRRGAVFSLALPMDNAGPQVGRNGRVNPQHVMLRDGSQMLVAEPEDFGFTDDAVYMPLQSSTQWDALCHVFYRNQAYNNRDAASVTSAGAQFNSITTIRDKAIGRGVLLDLPRFFGQPWLEAGDAIQAEDLEALRAGARRRGRRG